MDEDLCDALLSVIDSNVTYFRNAGSDSHKHFLRQIVQMKGAVLQLRDNCEAISQHCHLYDFDTATPGNGYRSALLIINRFLPLCAKLCGQIVLKRTSMFFRADFYQKELDAHLSVLAGMQVCSQFLLKMLEVGNTGDLFVEEKMSIRELLEEYGSLPQIGFYGRCAAFYFCESMRRIATGLNVVMASFSDQYLQSGGAVAHAVASLINCGKYTLDPEARANHIVDVTQNASLDFLKAFWSLNELEIVRVPRWLCPSLDVCDEITVPLEPQTLQREDGSHTVIPLPSAHKPQAPVRCKLLSYHFRKGQDLVLSSRKWFNMLHPPSRRLLLHCHGGGFVSQTPDSHEIYLRDWAKDLDLPILTVDYSLSPEAPFPRALEEVLHVYAWALNNREKLGWTGEEICVAGDSAGGNLVLALCLKAVQLGIRRPTGAFAAYTPVMLSMVASPSRVLCTVDPLLPLGFMLTCLHAYIGRANNDPHTPTTPSDRPPGSPDSGILSGSTSPKSQGAQWPLQVAAAASPQDKDNTSPVQDANRNIKTPLCRTKNVLQLSISGELPTTYLTRYASQLPSPTQSQPTKENQYDDFVVLDMPQDVTFAVRNRCCRAVSPYLRKVAEMINDNGFFKEYIAANWQLLCGKAEKKRHAIAVPWYKGPSRLDNKFRKMKLLASDPFISPYLAPEWMLEKMPPCYFVGLHLDPTLDDLVMMSKKLKGANVPVHLEILDYLPHAFLNFLPFSKEAHDGSKLCVRMIKKAFHIEHAT
uniref:Putative hormone-sensitive lipase hsl n=1 Tax=Ornithodoros turicata TaxID=34597 RepID=A0A2R5LF59_9ACAR